MAHTEASAENRAYFNDLATKYEDRFGKTLDRLVEEIQSRRDFIGAEWADGEDGDDEATPKDETSKRPVRLLDYACGTGLVSRALAPFTTQCVGIDISEAMIGVYNTKAENQGLTKEDMFAIHGDLLDPAVPSPAHLSDPEFFNFDIAAVGLGAHHFADPALAVKRLVERLKPGGVLMILDFIEHAPVAIDTVGVSSVMHHGFSKEQVKTFFEEGGAGQGFDMAILGRGMIFHGHGAGEASAERTVFIARGQKAAN
ncbi:uncharacterized protein BROUX77_004586 [Berkeleyomyces rouxiae]|uniref:uncharacterized protein n=1 Tax=Berkeleyomyces rouxiae TaxID=2035830 RepID=UPI003B7A3DDD